MVDKSKSKYALDGDLINNVTTGISDTVESRVTKPQFKLFNTVVWLNPTIVLFTTIIVCVILLHINISKWKTNMGVVQTILSFVVYLVYSLLIGSLYGLLFPVSMFVLPFHMLLLYK